jgi:hypothetical protein
MTLMTVVAVDDVLQAEVVERILFNGETNDCWWSNDTSAATKRQ